MIDGDGAILFALVVRGLLLVAGTVNLAFAFVAYRDYHDVRALRSLVASLSMFGGTVALAASSQTIRDHSPELVPAMRVLASAGVMMFIVGLLFAVWTWRRKRP